MKFPLVPGVLGRLQENLKWLTLLSIREHSIGSKWGGVSRNWKMNCFLFWNYYFSVNFALGRMEEMLPDGGKCSAEWNEFWSLYSIFFFVTFYWTKKRKMRDRLQLVLSWPLTIFCNYLWSCNQLLRLLSDHFHTVNCNLLCFFL